MVIEKDKKANCCRDCILGMDLLARTLPEGRGSYRTYSGCCFTLIIFLAFTAFFAYFIMEYNGELDTIFESG